MGKENSAFKYVFFAIVVLIVLTFIWIAVMVLFFGVDSGRSLAAFLPLIILTALYVPIVAVLVYRDAVKRGLNPWLWATVAAFIPSMIGLVIYLVIRTEARIVCINCGQRIQKDFKICPFCGHKQELLCQQCSEPVAADWKVCPHCGEKLAWT